MYPNELFFFQPFFMNLFLLPPILRLPSLCHG